MVFKDKREGWAATSGSSLERELIRDVQSSWKSQEYGRVLHTTDGGATWKQVFYGLPMHAIARSDEAVIAGGYALVRSTDGETFDYATSSSPIYDLAYAGGGKFIAVGEAGTWLSSDDAGRNWRSASPPAQGRAFLTAIDFALPGIGWAGGGVRDEADQPSMALTTDSGRLWREYELTNDAELARHRCIALDVVDRDHAWAVKPGAVFRFGPGPKLHQ